MQRDTPRIFVWAPEAEPSGEAVARTARERSEQERVATGGATRRFVSWPVLIVGAGVLFAVLALHLRTAVAAPGPVAVPDIPVYLGIAQWVGGDGLAPGDVPFQPGYGLLIAPLVAVAGVSHLGTQGEVVHYLALVVNSLAAVAAAVAAGRLGLVGSQRWWVAGAAGLIAIVHPSLSSASRIAWPETLLSVAVLVVALAVGFAAAVAGSAASERSWARAGLIAALAVAVHARMVVLVVAVVLTALLCRIGRRAWIALGAGLLVGGVTTAVALTLTRTWPAERLNEAAQLDRGGEPILTLAGQLLALGGGTAGLGVIGLIAGVWTALGLVRTSRSGDPDVACAPTAHGGDVRPSTAARRPEPLTAALVCVALGASGALLVGAWTLTGSERADALLYGRYVDPWAVTLAVVTLAWLATRHSGRRRTSAVLAVSAVVTLVACVLVVGAADGYGAVPRRIMTLSFSPAWAWLDERLGAVAVAALAATLVGVLLAWAASRAHAAAASRVSLGTLIAVVLALGAIATVSNHRHLADVGEIARNQVVSASAVSQAIDDDGLTCLAHDRTSVPDYALWLYRLELPEISHERVDVTAGDRPCSSLVIAHDNLGERCTNARHLVDEPAASWALWHLPHRTCLGA